MKTWHKVGLSLLTVGVTATSIYFGYKALKKIRDKKKASQDAAAVKEKEEKEKPAEAAKDTTETNTETKQP